MLITVTGPDAQFQMFLNGREALDVVLKAALKFVRDDRRGARYALRYESMWLADPSQELGALADLHGWGTKVELQLALTPDSVTDSAVSAHHD